MDTTTSQLDIGVTPMDTLPVVDTAVPAAENNVVPKLDFEVSKVTGKPSKMVGGLKRVTVET